MTKQENTGKMDIKAKEAKDEVSAARVRPVSSAFADFFDDGRLVVKQDGVRPKEGKSIPVVFKQTIK